MRDQIAETVNMFAKNTNIKPELVFGSKDEYITNDEGLFKFKIPAQKPSEDGTRTEDYEFVVWAKSNPLEGITSMSPIVFKNVEISYGFYRDKDGKQRKYWNLLAESVKKA